MNRRYFIQNLGITGVIGAASTLSCRQSTEAVPNIRWAMGWLLWRDYAGRDISIQEASGELKHLGADGIELTPRPGELARRGLTVESLKELLSEFGLAVSGHYFSAPFYETARIAEIRAALQEKIGSLRVLGARKLIIGPPGAPGNADRIRLIRQMAPVLNDLGRMALDQDVEIGIHPHLNTLVETPEEIHAVMDLTDPRVVFLSPDTGHILLGGGNVLEILRTYKERLNYFHFKDAAGTFHRPDFLPNMRELGRGAVDFPNVMSLLKEIGYRGWVNVEQDHTETSPERSAALSIRYINETLKPIYR